MKTLLLFLFALPVYAQTDSVFEEELRLLEKNADIVTEKVLTTEDPVSDTVSMKSAAVKKNEGTPAPVEVIKKDDHLNRRIRSR